ncbi:MAG: hypothetical protein LC808_39405 [Actinobacteria bacterium]|nr:hypothetical protein [Actinomycetota bacterium]
MNDAYDITHRRVQSCQHSVYVGHVDDRGHGVGVGGGGAGGSVATVAVDPALSRSAELGEQAGDAASATAASIARIAVRLATAAMHIIHFHPLARADQVFATVVRWLHQSTGTLGRAGATAVGAALQRRRW